jgi:serine/threonine protein kinase
MGACACVRVGGKACDLPNWGWGRTCRVKIADMGLAKTLSEDQSSFSFQVAGADGVAVAPTGLGGFFAPEVLREGRKTRMVDVFSLGCLVFFVLTLGGHPFELHGCVCATARRAAIAC